MATIVMTPGARQRAHELLPSASRPHTASMDVLLLSWSNGCRDLRRGPAGEAVWEIVTPARWQCLPVDNMLRKEIAMLGNLAVQVDGFVFLPDSRARAAQGIFVVDAGEDGFRVELQPR